MPIKTFEELLQDCEETIKEFDPNLDFKPGSILNIALTPFCRALAQLYENLETVQENSYIDTATESFLDLKVQERNIERKPATSSYVLVKFNKQLPNFQLSFTTEDNYIFTVSSLYNISSGDYFYVLKSVDLGTATNSVSGTFACVEYVDGLEPGVFVRFISKGQEQESDNDLRQRYLDTFKNIPIGGNIAQYKQIFLNYPGVGACKIRPPTIGKGGIINVYVLDENYNIPSAEFLKLLKEYVDPIKHSGEGYGVAPIGHNVIINTVSVKGLTIKLTVVNLSPSVLQSEIESLIKKALQTFFIEIRKTWSEKNTLVIYNSEILYHLLNDADINESVKTIKDIYIIDKDIETSIYTLFYYEIPELDNVRVTLERN